MALHWSATGIEVHKHVVRPVDGDLPHGFPDDFDNNVFTIRCTETGEAMLIDAANEHERLLEVCRKLGVTLVVETHGHWDHIQAVPAVRDAGIEVAITARTRRCFPATTSFSKTTRCWRSDGCASAPSTTRDTPPAP